MNSQVEVNKAFFYYVQAVMDADELFCKKQLEKIKKISMETKDKWIAVFVLLLSKRVENEMEYLIDIETQALAGNNSPILFLEAYFIIKEKTFPPVRQVKQLKICLSGEITKLGE